MIRLNSELGEQYKQQAIEELTALGVTFRLVSTTTFPVLTRLLWTARPYWRSASPTAWATTMFS